MPVFLGKMGAREKRIQETCSRVSMVYSGSSKDPTTKKVKSEDSALKLSHTCCGILVYQVCAHIFSLSLIYTHKLCQYNYSWEML